MEFIIDYTNCKPNFVQDVRELCLTFGTKNYVHLNFFIKSNRLSSEMEFKEDKKRISIVVNERVIKNTKKKSKFFHNE